MKARVKATGKIVEIVGEGIQNSNMVMAAHGEWFTKDELDIVPLSWKPFEPTYWQKLEHQYAGMAMQGILSNIDLLMSLVKKKADDYPAKYTVAEFAKDCAHALVEKMKEERE
jgi:hypothetical protein